MVVSPFIAVDWGTTNRRAYRIEDGRVTDTQRDARGVSTMTAAQYPGAIASIRETMGDLPVLLAGMVGSTIGWTSVAYVDTPASIEDLARAIHRIDTRTAIVPGLATHRNGRGDVMRGEEVQLLGAALAGQVPADALLCQPGTHCKWVDMRARRVDGFTTAMTGELFALIKSHGILARQLQAPVTAGEAFVAGVREGAERDLVASLFAIRAASVLNLRADSDAASFASGVIIGSDVAARVECGRTIELVADGDLATLYASAIETVGGKVRITPCETAFVAGMTRIQELST